MQSSSSAVSPSASVLPFDERRHARLGRWLVLAGFGGFIAWAALAPLDKGVPVSGSVVVAGSRQAVQHPSGGVIERILVRDGEQVRAGQVLVQVDATLARAQHESLQAQYVAARASEARLITERDGLENIAFAEALLGRTSEPWVATALALQRQLLHSRRQALRLELDALAENLAGVEARLRGLRASMNYQQEQRDTLREQLESLRSLAREGYIARNRLLDQERLYAQLNGAIAEGQGDIGQLQRQALELRLRSGQRQEEYHKDVRQQLADTQLNAEDLANRLRSAEFELLNTQVQSPASGTVVGLSVFTEGGVIAPGQQLMEIVPAGASLLVDARAPVELVDKLRPGLEVELMFSAFNQSKTPRVIGEVTLVSADRLLDEQTGEPYYLVRSRVSDAGMQQLAGLDIRPGMPVEAFVRTGERSLLNYLFKPLLDRTHLALAEE
ncbi:HlyD family type I secretion periplasmic adaptor subunit [Pseudomonas sp. ABC1]|uniref:HlyD family type I secretion periplasmic adaptor subunit n=1 Tax=Pseudomonas sp. ABC1 TaxID=2748080 RepID=UPI00211A3746|nr:HlyD family type I secretion periplasmic adaptor subunit [Pseudomonas sp. ABC1]